MKTTFIGLAAFVFAFGGISSAITITGFGTTPEDGASALSVDADTSLNLTQNALSLNATGSDLGGYVSGSFAGINLTGFDAISLTATVNGANPASNFALQLFNIDSTQSRTYIGNLVGLGTGTSNTVNLLFLSQTAAFDTVAGFQYTGNGAGSPVNITFDTLTASAVPEPSTYMLLGLGVAGMVLVSRRKVKAG